MTQSTFRWCMAVTLLAAFAWVWLTMPARAEWPQGAFSCRTYRADLIWSSWARRHCSGRWHRHTWKRYHRPAPNPEIMAAQILLKQLGYELDVDGFTGPATKNAIEVFQDEKDLEVTGILNRETKRALEEADGSDDNGQEWSRRPEICRENNDRECTCDPIIVFSGEHIFRDAEKEALKRWRGHVRSMLGETWMSWEKAADPKISHCWYTGTGERTTDGKQTRCVVQARACFGPPAAEQYSGSGKDD